MNAGLVITNTQLQLAELTISRTTHCRVCRRANLAFRPTSSDSRRGNNGLRSGRSGGCFSRDTRGGGGTLTHSRNANSVSVSIACVRVLLAVTSTE